MDALSFKLVIVGDQRVQKTTLLCNYYNELVGTTQKIDYRQSIFQNSRVHVQVDDYNVSLSLWDTTGQEKYQLLRTLAYLNADIILIAFLIDERETYINALEKWYPEVKQNCRHGTIAFLGVKTKQKQVLNTELLQDYDDQNEKNRVQSPNIRDCLYFQESDEKAVGKTVQQCLKQILRKKKVSHQKFQCQFCQII